MRALAFEHLCRYKTRYVVKDDAILAYRCSWRTPGSATPAADTSTGP